MTIRKIFLLTSFLFFTVFLFILVKNSFALHKKSFVRTNLKLNILKAYYLNSLK